MSAPVVLEGAVAKRPQCEPPLGTGVAPVPEGEAQRSARGLLAPTALRTVLGAPGGSGPLHSLPHACCPWASVPAWSLSRGGQGAHPCGA